MYSKLREGLALACDAEYFCPVALPVENLTRSYKKGKKTPLKQN
jgi:hypothetical protein